MKTEIEIQQFLYNIKSFFGAKLIGSGVFWKIGLLKFSELNDIDIVADKRVEEGLTNYMASLGYIQTVNKGKQIGYENGSCVFEKLPQGDFTKTNSISIDISFETNPVVFQPEYIIMEKFKRGTSRDLETLKIIINNKLPI